MIWKLLTLVSLRTLPRAMALSVVGFGLSAAMPVTARAASWSLAIKGQANTKVLALLKRRLPRTRVTGINCNRLSGLCEVSADRNLFYVDRSARYLMIGRVYDLETRTDLTATRLLELDPDLLVRGAAHGDDDAAGTSARGEGTRVVAPAAAHLVQLGELPKAGAIVWGPPDGPRVTVFTDLHCGFCKRLNVELHEMGARVEERPISVLGTRPLSEAALCARDPVAALEKAYSGETLPPAAAGCDTRGLDANEGFARRHGFQGTPVIVRQDGAVIEGYRDAATLTAWLKQRGTTVELASVSKERRAGESTARVETAVRR
jgi:thiol:disulfide interchange protein DsbC